MTTMEKIMELLQTPTHKYKGVPVNCFGLPTFSPFKKQTLRNSFSKLQKNGYIIKKESSWYINTQKTYSPAKKMKMFESPFNKKSPKNLILMFDIPEQKRKERGWLRRQLHAYGYILFQKSVWVGPSPLPKEFIAYMKELELWEKVKTFKLAKPFV